jgi:DNA-binding response OmpR family regulator
MWKILCASNSAVIRQKLDVLDRAFYEVRFASSFAEVCMRLVVERSDLYILDASLPRESAIRMVKTVRLVDQEAIVICISELEVDREKVLNAGADVFIKSPSGLASLTSTIDGLLDRR